MTKTPIFLFVRLATRLQASLTCFYRFANHGTMAHNYVVSFIFQRHDTVFLFSVVLYQNKL